MINPQILPPELGDPGYIAAYDVPRGTCPRCSTDQIVHLVIGMSTSDEVTTDEDWVSWVGCIHPGFDRSCAECGLTWDSRLRDEEDDA